MSQVNKEYSRLKALFINVDESKSELVDELLWKAAFLKVELDDLEKQIKVHGKIEKSNKGNVRQTIYYKAYLQSVSVYQSIIKTLYTIMGKNSVNEDDEFDEFINQSKL